ncbi:MAG: hypothetical protein ABIW82_05945 [Dokdonella sp.]
MLQNVPSRSDAAFLLSAHGWKPAAQPFFRAVKEIFRTHADRKRVVAEHFRGCREIFSITRGNFRSHAEISWSDVDEFPMRGVVNCKGVQKFLSRPSLAPALEFPAEAMQIGIA